MKSIALVALAATLLGSAVYAAEEKGPASASAGSHFKLAIITSDKYSQDEKGVFAPDAPKVYAVYRVIAGQGTIGLEILEQCPTVCTVYVQMSGGGLVSGVATALKRSRESIEVVGVEPAGAARMKASLAAGAPVTIGTIASIADGLLAVRPGDTTFRHVQAFVDRVVTVEDAAIVEAMRWLFTHGKLVAEPSGAITVAAAQADAPAARRDVMSLLGRTAADRPRAGCSAPRFFVRVGYDAL